MSATAIDPPDPDAPPALIFHWARRTRVHWRLGAMILLSLLAHAASFYVLQVAYTPTGTLLPPPARVVVVPLDQPENASLAHWLALLDPVLAAQPPLAPTAAVLDMLGVGYVPSYDANPPAFKPLDAAVSAEAIAAPPRPPVPGPVPINDAPTAKPASPADPNHVAPHTPSRVELGGGIDAFLSLPLPPVRFTGSSGGKPTEPTVFLVGARPEGGTPFLFPVRHAPAATASADADEADECARDYLARLPFHATGATEGAVWGRATFYWGDDSPTAKK